MTIWKITRFGGIINITKNAIVLRQCTDQSQVSKLIHESMADSDSITVSDGKESYKMTGAEFKNVKNMFYRLQVIK